MIIFLSIYSDGLVTNSHIFAAIQYGLNTSDCTYNTLDANAAPPQWVEQSQRQMKEACVYSKHLVLCTGSWPGVPGVLLVTVSNLIALSWSCVALYRVTCWYVYICGYVGAVHMWGFTFLHHRELAFGQKLFVEPGDDMHCRQSFVHFFWLPYFILRQQFTIFFS